MNHHFLDALLFFYCSAINLYIYSAKGRLYFFNYYTRAAKFAELPRLGLGIVKNYSLITS